MRLPLCLLGCLASVANVLAQDNSPGPVVIPASEHFEGSDGPWSTFDVRVGEAEQHVRVLVSTASPQTMVVLSDLGCSDDVFDDVPSGCAKSRGALFNLNDSSSWIDVGQYGINENGLGFQANLGYDVRAQWGLDEVGIGLTGPQKSNQTIAAFGTAEPLYLGLFGLNNQPVNFTELGNTSVPSFLSTLKDDEVIPSLSWSYTAGARYRLKQVYGQLIFAGYDRSRFTENSVSFTMADDLTRDLVVGLQSITYSGTTSTTLLSDAINVFIDSTDANLWLPQEVCEAFEEAFDLELDESSGLYLVNETHRNNLLDTDAEVTFRLSDDTSGGDTVSITFPYAAFDLRVEKPLVDNGSYYFPLKRASNMTQYTLGRVFLQEAYLSADYERKVFNVSACSWQSGAEADIVTISSTDGEDSEEQDSSDSSSKGLTGGEIAGIVVGAVGGSILLLALAVCLFLRRRRRSKQRAYEVTNIPHNPDTTLIGGPANDSSMPYSSADVSGWTPSTDSPRQAILAAHGADSSSTPELDGHQTHVVPNTELDGQEVKSDKPPVAQNPGVYELPGSNVNNSVLTGQLGRGSITPTSPRSSRSSDRVSDESPPSPLASTFGNTWGQDSRPVSDMVSPIKVHKHRPR